MKLTEAETSLLPSTFTSQYEKTAREVTNTLAEVGWFIKTRNRWYISDEGRAACKNIKDVEQIYKAAELLYEQKKQFRADILLTVENAEEVAWQQIWQYLNEMNQSEFKNLVADLLRALNYHLDWIAPPGKNHGHIDLVAYPTPLGSSGPRIKVHVRHQGQAATVAGLKAFMGTLNPHDLGIFVSSGGFTEQVAEAARSQELRKVRLVSLETFVQFWVQNYDKLSQEARQRFPLKPIYFLGPEK
ncbi:MAG TPA: restriction endonuclease [Anaerolineales bacterium]